MSDAGGSPRKRYFWDFFGPNAQGTARHFREHLSQFLERHAIEGCKLELVSAGPGHHAAACVAPSEAAELIEGALRPRRSEPIDP
jgi:hypothetical protein